MDAEEIQARVSEATTARESWVAKLGSLEDDARRAQAQIAFLDGVLADCRHWLSRITPLEAVTDEPG